MDDRRGQIGEHALMDMGEIGAAAALADISWEFHGANEFDRFAGEWDDINRAMRGVPALDSVFIASLLKEFGTGREMLAIGYDGKTAHAMAVLQRKPASFWETFQPAQSPLGAWVHRPPASLESFVPGLIRALPGFSMALGITQQDPDLVRRADDSGAVVTLDYIQTARVTISGTFDEYWAERGKNLRNNTKRQRSRLEKEGTALRLDTITDPADVAQAIDDYGRLESAGWKAQAGTAIHPDNAQGRFYRAMLEAYCRRGAGRIYRFRYGDSVVAVDLCIQSKDTLIVLKTTYDETIRDSSPASLMRHEYFRDVFNEGLVKRIEFYGKVMEWHTRWSDEIRTLYHANFYRWSWLAEARGVLDALFRRSRLTAGTAAEQLERPAAGRQSYTSTLYSDLSALDVRYEPLFSHAGSISVFHTLPWYRNFVRTVLASRERLRIYAVDAETKDPAARALLLMRYRESPAGAFGARMLSGLSNFYTSLFGPVIKTGEPDTQNVLDTFAAAIVGDEIRWDVIDLHPLDEDSAVFRGLVTAFKKTGLLVQTYFCFGNWYLQVRGRSYAEYFETLPSQLKNTIRRKKKQFESATGSRIVVYRDEADLDEGLRAYEQVYAASWKIPEPYPEFIRGLCRTCAVSGWLRLGVVYIDDQPASAQIWIVNDGIANIYKLAYDERFAKLSLGSILSAHLMEHVIDVDKVHEVDYLTGDEPYKKDWMSDRRERRGIVAFNLHTPTGLFAALRHVGARVARRALDEMRRKLAGS